MDFSINQKKIKQMTEDIELLKSFFNFPGMTLIYLDRFFDDLRTQVSFAFYLKSHYVTDPILLAKMESTWMFMNEKIREFEKECLISNDWHRVVNQLKEESDGNLKYIQKHLDFIETTEQLDYFNELVYEEKVKAEKHIFCNKTIAFLPSNLFDADTDHAGNLVLIENHYIGHVGIDFLRK